MSLLKTILFLSALLLLAACSDDENSSTSSGGSSGGSSVSGFTVTGRLVVASNVDADHDTNDLNAPTLASNNSFSTAQSIANPAIVGGHVNVAGSGNSGRTRVSGDVSDFYAVNLQAGQLVTLFIANVTQRGVDLDLHLYNSNGQIIDGSINTGLNESLLIRSGGPHVLEVRAEQGSSNYVLSLSQNVSGSSDASERGSRLSDDFATGQFIVELADIGGELTAQSSVDTLTSMGLTTHSFDSSRRMLFTQNDSDLRAFSVNPQCDQFATADLCAKYQTLQQLKRIQQRSDVRSASPNHLLTAYRIPNDPFYSYQWHYKMINVPQAWDATLGSANVIAAVIDSGVLLTHPDLRGQLVSGYDFISDSTISKDGDGIDPNPNDPGNKEGREGASNFHGTHVAGTIGAATNNGIGVAGVGWLTRVMPLRVLGRGGAGTEYDTEQAILYAAGLPNDSGTVPAQRADVINLSLGGPRISTGFSNAIAQARARGVVIVAASGNDGSSAPSYPAALEGVISVSAVGIDKRLAYYSNFGSSIDVAAPGGDKTTPDLDGDGRPDQIASTFGDDSSLPVEFTYYYQQGTSMAAPHVVGVIALMKAVNPSLSPTDIDNLISSGQITEDIGARGRDNQFGYGLIDARKAVAAAAQIVSGPPLVETAPALVVNPTSLNFGATTTSTTITVSNGGGGSLSVTDVTDDGGNVISVQGIEIDNNGLGTYQVNLNRGSLAAGTYSATIVFRSTQNTVRIPIILQVATQSENTSGDAGHHYILLVRPESLETVQETRASASNGVYQFRFTGVPAGSYQIIAGTDANNDNFICDSGEACGSYLTTDRPSTIDISRSTTLADFGTTYNVNFLTSSSTDSTGFKGFARMATEGKQVQP